MKPELYVIGDVHGCFDTLMALVKKIEEKSPDYKLCFTGDLIDRGPKSRQVVEFVKENNHDCVLGNHELMCVDWTGKWADQLWLLNGGDKTLYSYHEVDTEPPFLRGELDQELFDEHRNWMAGLPLVKEYEDYKTPSGKGVVVSHSLCINQWKHIKAGKDMTDHVVWNRKFHQLDTVDFINFIGHTIEPYNPKIDNQKYINIDTGAFLGTKGWVGYKCQGNEGNLTAINVETLEIIMQKCIDE